MDREPTQIVEVDGQKIKLIHHLAQVAMKVFDGRIKFMIPYAYGFDHDVHLDEAQTWAVKVCVYLLRMEGLCKTNNVCAMAHHFNEHSDHVGYARLDYALMKRCRLQVARDHAVDFKRIVDKCETYVDEALGLTPKITEEKLIRLYAAYDIALLAIEVTPEDDRLEQEAAEACKELYDYSIAVFKELTKINWTASKFTEPLNKLV